jgi:hypothetical protein
MCQYARFYGKVNPPQQALLAVFRMFWDLPALTENVLFLE